MRLYKGLMVRSDGERTLTYLAFLQGLRLRPTYGALPKVR